MEMRRFYVETNAYSMVIFVDENGKGFTIFEDQFDEPLTLEVAKNADYSNLDGCKTAKECAMAMGYNSTIDSEGIEHITDYNGIKCVIDFNEDDYENVIEF